MSYQLMVELNFSVIIDNLRQKALSDGTLTDEEEAFIDSLSNDIDKFESALKIAQNDDNISDDEFHELVILRDNILNKAMNFKSTSHDILELLKKLFEDINNYDLPGMTEDELLDDED